MPWVKSSPKHTCWLPDPSQAAFDGAELDDLYECDHVSCRQRWRLSYDFESLSQFVWVREENE